ncbi:MAG TPA: hypothetical protein VHR72_06035 [Gemmataceae bacterium]|jgi:hypothetical protein|nr:hypothetical protein [Gemmataceae bacterium]
MAVKTKCPHCGKIGKVRDESLGKKGRCNACRSVFVVERFVEPEPIPAVETATSLGPQVTVVPDRTVVAEPTPPSTAEPVVSPFADGKIPPPHESWGAERIRIWQFEPKEPVDSAAAGPQVPLRLHAGEGASQIALSVREQIVRLLTEEPERRTRPLNWNVADAQEQPVPDRRAKSGECSEQVRALWDGMRRLPYANRQIALCIGNYLAMQGGDDEDAIVEEMFGPHLGLELGGGSSRSRSRASVTGLRTSFRTDMPERMASWHPSERDIHDLLGRVTDPTRLFDFPRLVELFAREIVPNQLLVRTSAATIFFSPSQVSTIGNG